MDNPLKQAAKLERYQWACKEIQQAIEAEVFGSITFHMADGVISAAETKSHKKALVDNGAK